MNGLMKFQKMNCIDVWKNIQKLVLVEKDIIEMYVGEHNNHLTRKLA